MLVSSILDAPASSEKKNVASIIGKIIRIYRLGQGERLLQPQPHHLMIFERMLLLKRVRIIFPFQLCQNKGIHFKSAGIKIRFLCFILLAGNLHCKEEFDFILEINRSSDIKEGNWI